ncbi:hypothetical protein RI129_010380 [Pyrocoelia pectoralis]|uniref:Uncharacterized protein n=1 Tax=Pyrocoelia pectoralis TaxID=417401 RepID=A0AAN7V7V6_9COLE
MYAHQLLFTICLLGKCFVSKANPLSSTEECEAYHWRDYYNNVPRDAFLAAVNNNGNPMYVAQVLHWELLIPGFISDPELNVAIYEYGNEERKALKNVKILCADDTNKLEWIKSNTSDFLIDEKYIVGGFESENKVFIGKSYSDGEPVLGKVIVHKSDPVFLHATQNGTAIRLKNFEVLSVVRHHRTTTASTMGDNNEVGEKWSRLTSDGWFRRSTRSDGWFRGSTRPDGWFRGSTRPDGWFRGSTRPDGWFRRSTRPFVQDKSPIAVSGNVKSLMIRDDKECTCSKGTVIINFN